MQWLYSLYKFLNEIIHNRYDSIPAVIKNKWSPAYYLTHSPLLNRNDLVKIRASAVTSLRKPLTTKHEVSTLLVGERSSAYAGSGYEFAENQLYVTGDDSRFINWRLLARTGKLYRKKFIEERRPELWVVVDKRASMRFGTRRYLKVTQAAIQALYHLYEGQQQQLACAGIIVDEEVRWYKPAKELRTLNPLIEGIIAPAPPLHSMSAEKAGTDNLHIILRQLVSRATPGSIIILLSDFLNLSQEVQGSLHLLTRKHHVIAKHIADPIELELPVSGSYQVVAQPGQQEKVLDCNDENIRQQYQHKAEQWQQGIKEKLSRAGVNYELCMSNKSLPEGADHG